MGETTLDDVRNFLIMLGIKDNDLHDAMRTVSEYGYSQHNAGYQEGIEDN